MNLSLSLLLLSSALYGAAFVFHLLSFSGIWEKGHRPAFSLMRVGFLVATFYFAAEGMERGFFLPVVNFSQALAFFAWSLAFVYLVFLVRIQTESFGLILTPILFALTLVAALAKNILGNSQESPRPVLLNPYFTVHIASAFFAYAAFALSFVAGLLYLIQHHELKAKHAGRFYHKLPSLEELERLIYQPLKWGAPLLLAAVGIGFLWSKSAYGRYWIFDPKTLATAVVVVLYGTILYLRSASFLRGKQVAVWSLVAFTFVLVSFIGTRFLQGSHNFF